MSNATGCGTSTTPGCPESFTGKSGCESTSAANNVNPAANNVNPAANNESKRSIASIALAAPITATLTMPAAQAQAFAGAASIVLADTISPTVESVAELFAKLEEFRKKIYGDKNAEILKHETDRQLNEKQNDTFKTASEFIIDSAKKKSVGKLSSEIAANFIEATKEIADLKDKMFPLKTIGGKKIISRTHKSINQFLNPKITAANMLKSKKRFRNNKSKSKYKSKKRRFH
jgi:hypothetical protein